MIGQYGKKPNVTSQNGLILIMENIGKLWKKWLEVFSWCNISGICHGLSWTYVATTNKTDASQKVYNVYNGYVGYVGKCLKNNMHSSVGRYFAF